MEINNWTQRLDLIHVKFSEKVVLSGVNVRPTWERFGEFLAIRSGLEPNAYKQKLNRWKKGQLPDALDCANIAKVFGLNLVWVVTGEGEMSAGAVADLPSGWTDEKKAPDGA